MEAVWAVVAWGAGLALDMVESLTDGWVAWRASVADSEICVFGFAMGGGVEFSILVRTGTARPGAATYMSPSPIISHLMLISG